MQLIKELFYATLEYFWRGGAVGSSHGAIFFNILWRSYFDAFGCDCIQFWIQLNLAKPKGLGVDARMKELFLPAGGQHGGGVGAVWVCSCSASDSPGLWGALEDGEGRAAVANAVRLPSLPGHKRRLPTSPQLNAAAPASLPPREMLHANKSFFRPPKPRNRITTSALFFFRICHWTSWWWAWPCSSSRLRRASRAGCSVWVKVFLRGSRSSTHLSSIHWVQVAWLSSSQGSDGVEDRVTYDISLSLWTLHCALVPVNIGSISGCSHTCWCAMIRCVNVPLSTPLFSLWSQLGGRVSCFHDDWQKKPAGPKSCLCERSLKQTLGPFAPPFHRC